MASVLQSDVCPVYPILAAAQAADPAAVPAASYCAAGRWRWRCTQTSAERRRRRRRSRYVLFGCCCSWMQAFGAACCLPACLLPVLLLSCLGLSARCPPSDWIIPTLLTLLSLSLCTSFCTSLAEAGAGIPKPVQVRSLKPLRRSNSGRLRARPTCSSGVAFFAHTPVSSRRPGSACPFAQYHMQ